jgi:iron complex outermembrane receptor protein
VRHALTFGLSYTSRRDSFGDYVYDYAGSSNIYHNEIVPPAPGNPKTGPVSVRHRDQERGAYAQDIISLSERVVLHAGLRFESVRSEDAGEANTRDSFLLPNLALVYRATDAVNLYASAAQGMEYGGMGDIGTLNYGIPLSPKRSRQFELGAKASVNDALQLSAALFQIRRGHEYTRTNADDTTVFVREGLETNRGIELSAQGKVLAGLDYGVSLTALNTQVDGTTSPDINGKRVTDVPALKTSTWLMWDVPAVPGLKADARWQYAGKKAFDEANTVFVPGYHVFGLGASYGLRIGSTKATLRASVDNVFNKFYWRDVTPDLGGYLIPGAPRTFALSLQVSL